MDNIRVFLWLTLLGMAWLTYTAWQADYGAAAAQRRASTRAPQPTPQRAAHAHGRRCRAWTRLPSAPRRSRRHRRSPRPPTGELIRVRTDVLDVAIASQGGDLVRADLLQYPVDKDVPEPVVRLLDESRPERWVFQTGLRSAVGGAEPNHLATFRSAEQRVLVGAGRRTSSSSRSTGSATGRSARARRTRSGAGATTSSSTLTVAPTAGGSWRGAPYVQMERVHVPVERSYMSVDSYSFKGPCSTTATGSTSSRSRISHDTRHAERRRRLVRFDPASLPRGRGAADSRVSIATTRACAAPRTSCSARSAREPT